MDITVDKSSACMAKISFTVPSADLEREIQTGLQAMGARTNMKGFRPGKVPAKVLEKNFGKEIRKETIQKFVREAYETAVKDEDLRPASHPEIKEEQLEVLIGADLKMDFELCLRPEIELGDTKGMELKIPKVEIDDDELERALAEVRTRQSSAVKAEEGEGIEENGMALAKMTFMLGAEILNEREGLRVGPEQIPPGIDEETYKQALIGAVVGAEIEVPILYPEDFPEEKARGENGTCCIQLSEIYRIVPPDEEAMFKMFEAENEADMITNATARLTQAKTAQRDQMVETQLLEQLLATYPMELPTPLVERQVTLKINALTQELANKGVAPEEAQAQIDAESETAYESAAKSLSALYLVEAIGQKEDLKIADEDMMAELQSIAQRNNAPLDTVRDYYREQNLFPQLATELLEKKVRVYLRENASLTEE
ncbi:MAG: trigger factor [Planctomycetota bacterium]|jgi:trigger factor